MSEQNDGAASAMSSDGSGSDTTPDAQSTSGQDPIALARKRQAGAEAARQKAEEQAATLAAELEKYRANERTQADKDLADNAKLQEKLAAAERRAQEAEAKAQARILDTLYPNARKELPEVTDEVRLAKFEALLREDDDSGTTQAPPPPQNPNESNRTASADATAKPPKEESSKDILAKLKLGGMPEGWL